VIGRKPGFLIVQQGDGSCRCVKRFAGKPAQFENIHLLADDAFALSAPSI
jgi:hypothetical protein